MDLSRDLGEVISVEKKHGEEVRMQVDDFDARRAGVLGENGVGLLSAGSVALLEKVQFFFDPSAHVFFDRQFLAKSFEEEEVYFERFGVVEDEVA